MAYQNWVHSRAWVASFSDWYEKNQLLEVLYDIRENYFNPDSESSANRLAARQLLNSVIISTPYSQNERFPEDGEYICDAAGNWNSSFSGFHMLCEFKNHNEGAEDIIMLSFREVIAEMIDNAEDGVFVFDRVTFETWGEVTWTEVDAAAEC